MLSFSFSASARCHAKKKKKKTSTMLCNSIKFFVEAQGFTVASWSHFLKYYSEEFDSCRHIGRLLFQGELRSYSALHFIVRTNFCFQCISVSVPNTCNFSEACQLTKTYSIWLALGENVIILLTLKQHRDPCQYWNNWTYSLYVFSNLLLK